MDKKIVERILKFLTRVPLEGYEVDDFQECIKALKKCLDIKPKK